MSTEAKVVKLNNAVEVKKWLRSIPVIKKDIENKISFYEELAGEFVHDENWKKEVEHYRNEMKKLKNKLNKFLKEYERVLRILDDKERLVLNAKYLKCVRWDYIEMHVFYSRRQAIRIRDAAVNKLIGQMVEV